MANAKRFSFANSAGWRAGWLAISMLAALFTTRCKWLDPVETENLCRQGPVVSMNCPQCRGPSYAGECPICQRGDKPSGCGPSTTDNPATGEDASTPEPSDGQSPGTGVGESGQSDGTPPGDGGEASGSAGMSGPAGGNGSAMGEAGGSAPASNPPGCQNDDECIAVNPSLPACDPISLECQECINADHCREGAVCDPQAHTCIECNADADCESGACADAHCVPCNVNEQCPDDTLDQCDPEQHICVDCVDRSGCATGACDELTHACVDCLIDTDCPDAPYATCDEAARKCVDCTAGRGCDEAPNETCLEDEQRCVDCLDDSGCQSGEDQHCKLMELRCVECTSDSHCGDRLCLNDSCVECKGNDDCPDAAQARCDEDSHECSSCTEDSQCEHLDDTPVCSGGRCVECNDDGTCNGRSCIRGEHRCSDTRVGTLDVCSNCEADSMCMSDMKCIPLSFASRTVGNFCAWTRGRGCSSRRPYSRDLGNVRSIDGANEAHCGPPSATTCQGVRDVVTGQTGELCSSSGECGAEGFDDALCNDGRCTYTCASNNDCPSNVVCLENRICG